MKRRLVVRSEITAQESLRGYILRLTGLNQFASIWETLVQSKLTQSFQTQPQSLRRLSGVTGCRQELLVAATYWPALRHQVRFGKSLISIRDLNLEKPRICIACVDEGGLTNRLWDLRAYAVCHVHGNPLVDWCSMCRSPLVWYRGAPCRCQCGAKLGHRDIVASVESQREAASLLARICNAGRTGNAGPFGSLEVAAASIWLLGTMQVEQKNWRSAYMEKPNVIESLNIISAGYAAISDWPRGFRDWIDGQVAQVGAQTSRHLTVHFSSIFTRLRAGFMRYQADEVFDEMRGHLLRMGYTPGFKSTSFWYQKPTRSITGVEAAKRLAVTQATVKSLLQRRALDGYTAPAGTRTVTFVREESLAALERVRAETWTLAATAELMSVSRLQLKHLILCGLLTGGSVGRGRYSVNPRSVNALLEKLKEIAPPNSRFKHLIKIVDLPRRHKVGVAEVVSQVLMGKMHVYRMPVIFPLDFKDFCVDEGELDIWSLRGGGPGTLTGKEAARVLGVSIRMIPVLVEYQLLCVADATSKRRSGKRIRQSSIVEFKKKYIWTREIAKDRNAGEVHRRLHEVGLRPVIMHESRRGVSAVWLRSDIERSGQGLFTK